MHTMRNTILLSILLACSVSIFGQTTPAPAHRDQVATVAGQPILASELDKALQSPLWQLRTQEYELRSRVLEVLINQKLLEMEAAKRGIAADKLLRDEVDGKIGEPTDGEIEAFYLGQKSRLNRPMEELRPQLRQALKQARIEEARQKYFNSLRDRNQIAVLLRRPIMEPDATRLRGNPEAPVTIVEFSDLQCPFCRLVQPTLKQLLQKYGDRVNLSFRDMPLDQIHPDARRAAEAGRCAAEQGKFWEYQDALFTSGNLSEKGLAEQARSLGLDIPAFDTCVASRKFKNQVEDDVQMGLKAGVSGTPGFFINGVALSGSQPMQAFEKIIDAELAATAPVATASSPARKPAR